MNRTGLLFVSGGALVAVAVAATVYLSRDDSSQDAAPPAVVERSESAGESPAPAPAEPAAEAPAPQATAAATQETEQPPAETQVERAEAPAPAQVAEAPPREAEAPAEQPAAQSEPEPPAAEQAPEKANGSGIQVIQRAALPETPETQEAPPPPPPSFDVVRVEPSGETVVAGRAAPGSTVTVLSGDTAIGSVTADGRGQWVLLTDQPLQPGSHELSLRAELPQGPTLESVNVVIVAIPEPPPETAAGPAEPATGPAPLAVLTPRRGPGATQVLQKPEDSGISDRELVLSAVDYDPSGQVVISGSATPDSTVLVYLDNALLGQAKADESGRWALTPESAVTPGLHRLRVDQVADDGSVVARIETPFSRSESMLDLPEERFVVVQPGNSLWRIARFAYGEGPRFTVIYQSNREQIRDPDLIYPGQIFMVPEIN